MKLGNLVTFAEMLETDDATFFHPDEMAENSRLVKMRVNAPQAVTLWVTPIEWEWNEDYSEKIVTVEHDDQRMFLGALPAGFDVVEFFYLGSFKLNVLGGNVWLDTVDGAQFVIEGDDMESFARVFERAERDPRILEMERAARHNSRRLEEQAAADKLEHQRRVAELTALRDSIASAQAGGSASDQSQSTSSSSGADEGANGANGANE